MNMGQHRQLVMIVDNANSVHPVNMQGLCSNMLQQHGRPIQQINLRAAWQTVVGAVFKADGDGTGYFSRHASALPRNSS